jgi:hypothetical protein
VNWVVGSTTSLGLRNAEKGRVKGADKERLEERTVPASCTLAAMRRRVRGRLGEGHWEGKVFSLGISPFLPRPCLYPPLTRCSSLPSPSMASPFPRSAVLVGCSNTLARRHWLCRPGAGLLIGECQSTSIVIDKAKLCQPWILEWWTQKRLDSRAWTNFTAGSTGNTTEGGFMAGVNLF